MEILNPLSTPNPHIFSALSLLSNRYSIKIYANKNLRSFKIPFFKFPLQTSPILLNSPLDKSRNFRVSAHFNRPTGRRKSHLRKKLIEQQVHINHHLTCTLENPARKIDDNNNSLSNLGISDDYSVSNPDNSKLSDTRASNTVLWNQLESWANQYKADAEFWGIGSNPIFTVFQDSSGEVDKVDVNEDEILRRSLSLNEVENVKHKISHAKLLAKEMEIGKNVLPPNTSVAKFIVNSSGTLGFHDTIRRSFTGKPAKLSSVGISVFCGLLVFVALNKFFRKEKGDNKKECYSSLEKEMLRRKMKARMGKEESVKGRVEVIKEPEPVPEMMVFKESRPPQLDKEELMNNIVKVKSLDDTTFLDFDGKIQEIRAMAREIEKTTINDDDESINNGPDGKEVNHIKPQASFDVPVTQGDVSCQDIGHSSDIPNIDEIVVEDDKGSDTEKLLEKKSVGVKLRIISSVKEAREYLHKKEKPKVNSNNLHERASNDDVFGNRANKSCLGIDNTNEECVKGSDGRANRDKWMEDNFHEFEPLVEKIRGGFRNNYMVAREKVRKDIDLVSELELLESDENEFEWMKDEKLREIVFQVRENELIGRNPFYLMDTQDKALFFAGLEKKVEKENKKLAHLHQYLHSNIENLDYGADGISLYDPPEKMIPRWKGPPPATTMNLDDYLDQRKALFAETLGNEKVESKKNLKTVIEGSDGSIKPGKKSGKEFWEHTKKWSRGFIDSYNAENDPETKAVMKDIGKDLDRWITEKEIQDAAADIMDKVPDKGKKLISEKINKLKREMELFGPQAVVSKYSEYGDEEEIDYYWWLDLPFLLCIELYIDGDGNERIGFYSLEMASDLELDPKPHHIIAFEDAGDCKNLCYIIQAHMEMLGNGNAFVVPQVPKDTYREAKGNGFNVTVIRKGELKLDVDQTLEEVEEKIVQIGSKMYHAQIMKAHNVDVDSIMKGVFGLKKPTNRRRSKKKLKNPTK